MKQSGNTSKASGKHQESKRDRKSGSGFNGSPKKGGHGGKFTWSGDGYSEAELGCFDKEAIIHDGAIKKINVSANNP
ncbi:hypothetical protein LIER_32068 [Lithospermum erythrorhizon]|uniref:Programmed cell death protein 4-like n=1 Tax=Lithospermum erythrorhizon TaxID=34254 RepID=A0AAV3RV94_LITER